MTIDFKSAAICIAASAPRSKGVTARRFATLMTGGAAVLALVLATAMPARADKKDDLAKALIAALVIGAILHETKRDTHAPTLSPNRSSSRVSPRSARSRSPGLSGRWRSIPKAVCGTKVSTRACRAVAPMRRASSANATGCSAPSVCAMPVSGSRAAKVWPGTERVALEPPLLSLGGGGVSSSRPSFFCGPSVGG